MGLFNRFGRRYKQGELPEKRDRYYRARDQAAIAEVRSENRQRLHGLGWALTRFVEVLATASAMNEADFQSNAVRLVRNIRHHRHVRNILSGRYFPILIPQVTTGIAWATRKVFLPAASSSLQRYFPNHPISPWDISAEELAALSEVAGSRYERLLEKLRAGPVVALVFPCALPDLTDRQALERLQELPPGFILGGPLDTLTALAMYPREYMNSLLGHWRFLSSRFIQMPAGRIAEGTSMCLMDHAFTLSLCRSSDDYTYCSETGLCYIG